MEQSQVTMSECQPMHMSVYGLFKEMVYWYLGCVFSLGEWTYINVFALVTCRTYQSEGFWQLKIKYWKAIKQSIKLNFNLRCWPAYTPFYLMHSLILMTVHTTSEFNFLIHKSHYSCKTHYLPFQLSFMFFYVFSSLQSFAQLFLKSICLFCFFFLISC